MAEINDIASYIWRRSKDYNVNPAMALGIAKSEGLNSNTIGSETFGNRDARGYSFGPFQLYSGSSDPTKIAPGGMAYEFQQKFGEAPSAANWQKQVDFSLERMANKGVGDWYAVRDRGGVGNITKIGEKYAGELGLNGDQAAPSYTAPWSNAASALGDIDKRYLGGGFGFLGKQASNLLGMVTPEGSASLPAAAPSPIGFTEPMQKMGSTLPLSLMGPAQPPGGVGPMATAGGGQAAMAAVPLAPKDTGFSIDNLNAGQAAGFAGLGNALIAAGAPKMTWKPSGEAAPAYRGQWRDDIFAGLLGPRAWG